MQMLLISKYYHLHPLHHSQGLNLCNKIGLILMKIVKKLKNFPGGFAPTTPTGACSPWTLLAGAPPPTPPPGLRPWPPCGGFQPHTP